MVTIIEQQTFSIGGLESNIFLLQVDAVSRQVAKIKSRGWARAEFPFVGPNDITVFGARSVRDPDGRGVDILPLRTDHRVQVSVRR